MEALQQLERVRGTPAKGLTMMELAVRLEVESLQLEPVLATLTLLDWVGPLDEVESSVASRYVLLADPDATALSPLMELLLLERVDSTENLWENARLSSLNLRDVL